ncbi:MAG TPA: TIR domain-containing protein [Xanthobacteraceae bacterium]|nr:TIR domain-containing protein [Xanthobacteraceae bacterium]
MDLPKPIIFISYSHKDEPEHPRDGEIQWLSFVRTYLQPAVKHDIIRLWVDRHMPGGADWDPEIERNLSECDIFVLLVSANSMASDYIVDREIAIIRERQAKGEEVHFYPLLLTPTPDAGLDKVKDKNLRPRDGQPFSGYSHHERLKHMTEAANEIAKIAKEIAERKAAKQPISPVTPSVQPAYVHITGLPETAYERLVGRDTELKRLDEAWVDRKTNILSLVAEGGAGKSALVNEWLKRMQADSYRGAEAVLGWSFYSQGSKERATSAEPFLNWALDKLGIKLDTTSATAKAEAIAEALARRRVLLVLDGVEPLQHGLGTHQGELKDLGLRALLRRFAAMPPAQAHGLVVLTSRLAIKDIARWKDGAAPVVDVEKLSDDAGAALLRDNGVWGTDAELRATARAFGGHPLALGLLASFLKETQFGDVRRRDRIRKLLDDPENPRHDHAKRVMESYEREWLSGQPVPHAIMHMVGLFDRPASGDCLAALRKPPAIPGLTDAIVDLDETEWRRGVARLRDVRLMAPVDPATPDALDAHPLVREWFGQRLEKTNLEAWRAAHGLLYEHLRDTTHEGDQPTLEDLAPLYQAIPHGCRAGRHQEVRDEIYVTRIYRWREDGKIEFYALRKLGAVGSNLAALTWFFEKPYDMPIAALTSATQAWVLGEAAFALNALGRFAEALPVQRAGLEMNKKDSRWRNAAIGASNLSQTELLIGHVPAAAATAAESVMHADKSGDEFQKIINLTTQADALSCAGKVKEAEHLFAEAEDRQKAVQPKYPLLYSAPGYNYCCLLLARSEWTAARERALVTIQWTHSLLSVALDTLTLGRAHLGIAIKNVVPNLLSAVARENAGLARDWLNKAVDRFRAAGTLEYVASALRARAAFHRSLGKWEGAAHDLDEADDITEPGVMRLHLCSIAFERARLAFARIEAFAPLNGLIDDSPPKPEPPGADERAKLAEEARVNLATARELIESCGYHRRDEELAELEAVRDGHRCFADLPPRV